jgi:hypothetical protein
MKKLVSTILAAGCFAIMASTAMATPVYHGNTNADIAVNQDPVVPATSGYYIWSHDPMRKSWSVRWTGNSNPETILKWFGSIEIAGGLNLTSTKEVEFETGIVPGGPDTVTVNDDGLIKFTAYSGTVWDGIDFTIDGNVGNVIGFNLGCNLFDGQTVGSEITASNIFIGDQLAHPEVIVQEYRAANGGPILGRTENFEIPAPVPEPGTMMLLGAGCLGLAIYGKRRKNA